MKSLSTFQRSMIDGHGSFNGSGYTLSTDSVTWIHPHSIEIDDEGQLFSVTIDQRYILLTSLQSCQVQIYPTLHTSVNQMQRQPVKKRLARKTSSNTLDGNANGSNNGLEEPPVVFIKTYDNDKLYIRVSTKESFTNLLSALAVWQSMKPSGLVKKWYCENKVDRSTVTDKPHELLVCRCKVYGPIPMKVKNLKIVDGPKAPSYHPILERNNEHNISNGSASHQSNGNDGISEGWFYTMGVLKSNGSLNFISELDGTLIFSIDVKSIMTSEIREVHHSLFERSNILFVGQIKELRANAAIKSVSPLYKDQLYPSFLTKDGKAIPNNKRIFIEFPLHIDLEDWFVGLNYFAKKEYIGAHTARSRTSKEEMPNSINDYSKESFRVSKKISIDIIEAKFDQASPTRNKSKVYAEVYMWGLSWSRTALVNWSSNPFWKEEFFTDLPISTQMIHIVIKEAVNGKGYSVNDKLVGTVYVTPDVLSKQVGANTTIMSESAQGNSMTNSSSMNSLGGILNNDIVKLSIYDGANLRVGHLMVNVSLKEYHVLSPPNFKSLEKMLANAPMKGLIKFCNDRVSSSDYEKVSLILLDVFQSLNVETEWFKSLMEEELVDVDLATRKNYVSGKRNETSKASSSNNVFNTLFRGSSIFSKSLEKYNLRVGQEYLEKVFGDFFTKLETERKSCEIDPRYVRIQERAQRLKKSPDDSDLESDDDELDPEEERAIEARVSEITNENFKNLYSYAEEIWKMIYATSNDLPQQIKYQLKNFRTKVELACDPDDGETALNCISAFIFLRFFCPAILNPKLFYLTRNHQTGMTQRTLTLIAKVLLNLANRQTFLPHKEPHLVKMNKFLEERNQELLEYFDKITGRKNDFNEKILDLSHEMKRFDLGISGDSTSSELPTTPYLIDKYLRLTEFVQLFELSMTRNISTQQLAVTSSQSSNTSTTSYSNTGTNTTNDVSRDGNDEFRIDTERSVYQIGSLEFEKSEFLDLAGDNETEGFLKSLIRSDENVFSFINSNITLKDIQKVCTKLSSKVRILEEFLENPEYPANFDNQTLWTLYVNDICSRYYVDLSRNCLVYLDKDMTTPSAYRKVIDNAFMHMKLKFTSSEVPSENGAGASDTNSLMSKNSFVSKTTSSRGSSLKSAAKNSFKLWSRKS